MKNFITLLFLVVSFTINAQVIYSWTPNVNPGWASSNPSVNTLAFQPCYGFVSTSDCIGSQASWNTYNNGQITSYTSPTYSFACTQPTVQVDLQLDILLENRYDWFYFQYSTNSGVTWINPVALSGGGNPSGVNLSAYNPLTTACNTCNRNGWTGSVGFINPVYTISNTGLNRFRFIFASDGSVNTYFPSNIYYADILDFSVSCINPLPIELTSFTGVPKTCSENELKWTTATEINNDRFEIEKSTDGMSFVYIGQEQGVGTSSQTHNYDYIDAANVSGVVYYRLKQIDFDGTFTYSSIIAVTNTCILPKVLYVTDLLGQNISDEYQGPRIIHYDDGTVKKVMGPTPF